MNIFCQPILKIEQIKKDQSMQYAQHLLQIFGAAAVSRSKVARMALVSHPLSWHFRKMRPSISHGSLSRIDAR